MSDNSLDEGVALVQSIILVAESEDMTACELAWQSYDRLLCLQQTIRQPARKMKRKSSSYQKKTCCNCWTIKSRRYRYDLNSFKSHRNRSQLMHTYVRTHRSAPDSSMKAGTSILGSLA